MKSLAFPNIFTDSSTKLYEDHAATASNLKLLLLSDKMSLLGDPYFGTSIKSLMFEQNSTILQDTIIDEIYTAILQFMPQIRLERKDIKVTSEGPDVFVNIKATNMLDYTPDLYSINLLTYEVI